MGWMSPEGKGAFILWGKQGELRYLLSAAMTEHHDQNNSQNEDFIWAHGSRGLCAHDGRNM